MALDFGATQEVKSFSFDEEKMALYINFQDIIIVRKNMLEENDEASVETVFSLA
jgi:hypothetical protein